MAILRDPRTGQVRGFLRELDPTTQAAAARRDGYIQAQVAPRGKREPVGEEGLGVKCVTHGRERGPNLRNRATSHPCLVPFA